jgi:hypothetical protein
MRYAFDIDNTLVSTKDNDYANSVPIFSRISHVNRLYDEDNYIILYTARGSRSGKDYRELTESQMKKFGIKYHELVMGKVDCDYFIDDKALTLKDFDSMMNSRKSTSSNYKSGSDSGYSFDDFKRFESLRGLDFKSVLDVGSGPCMLLTWLNENKSNFSYEATDIREEALSNCSCKTYLEIPAKKKYDIVCLFGVSDYCDNNEKEKKEEFKNLLINSVKASKKLVVFSLIKDSVKSNRLVRYSIEEIKELSILSNLDILDIDSESEPTEYVVKCNLKMVNNEAKEKQATKKAKSAKSAKSASKPKKKNNDSNSIL